MVDRYYRKIEDVENDIENAMQISSILLKLKEYDNDLGKISTNTGAISTNSGLMSTNEGNISRNEGNISTNEGNISINEGNISTNEGNISTNEGNISSNLSKINNIENDMKISNDIYNETFIIPNMSTTWRSKLIFDKTINSKFTTNGIIKINATYNYIYDIKYNFKHIYHFYDNNNKEFKKFSIYNNRISNIVKDEFEIQGIDSTEIKLLVYLINNVDNKKIELFDDNTMQIIYNETNFKSDINKDDIASNLGKINDNSSDISDNLGKINTNISAIASNLGKINDDKDDIIALHTINVKAFYNLNKIFIYDIEKADQTVDKDNHYHIFEKEITNTFIKNSYLEIILKVLTEISNYVLIGFFQILCNFYDENDDLFYTISLSTAMGSINKLSTIKSVFIVPINKNMTKIKIDFFIMPKPTQQNRSAKFIIKDINSNKIYVKYFQKTDEMSIKDIQHSLNNVNNIISRIDKIEKNLYLKNLLNILYHENDLKASHIFFEKTYTINAKKNDFLEIYFKMLLKYDDISNAKYVNPNFIFYDDNDKELHSVSYDNSDYIGVTNINILLNNTIYYNFDSDTTNFKILISFSWTRSNLNIILKSINTNRLIIKHHGN